MPAHQLRRRVAFSETDAAGILHFSRYAVWMEDCEHAFFRSLGFTVHGPDSPLFPRVQCDVSYRSPLAFEDEVDMKLWVVRVGRSSIAYRFAFVPVGAEAPAAVGDIVCVCCGRDADGTISATTLPEDLAEALADAVSDDAPPASGGAR